MREKGSNNKGERFALFSMYMLAKYGTTHLVFNNDIQGTAVVVLAGLVASLKLLGVSLADHMFLFFGAGEDGTGIAELTLQKNSADCDVLIMAVLNRHKTNTPVEEACKNIWLIDSKESLQAHKKPWAHEHEPVNNLLDTVKAIKPAAIIGKSGVGRTFTKEVIEAMTFINKRPLIMALSNPTAQSECIAEEAYTWSEAEPSSQVEVHSLRVQQQTARNPNQNNCYMFPGFSFDLVMVSAIRVHNNMLLAACVATRLPPPADLVKYAKSCMYTSNYHSYR
ncbi:hypothetical protein H5410_063878 [Solanum commersonii]|uniref:Malic enzyme NAD-binding domain-containing protein n=1 Tax=Solanum commersonii TaxID=4109 RepID=A0A9J5WGM4_SOLCO|nr:hypothetical protein H5410_063878 [Solanum commersonii]